jgi:malate synthase
MSTTVERSGMQVDGQLAAFIEAKVLAPLKHDPQRFWAGFAALCERFVPRNRELLAKRDALQAQIDDWQGRSATLSPNRTNLRSARKTSIARLPCWRGRSWSSLR